MPIIPLPVFEAEADPIKRGLSEEDAAAFLPRSAPESLVVKYGYNNHIAELPSNLDHMPGCGSKLVLRTHRGTEIGMMLATTCSNSGCSASLSRPELLDYIKDSGGKLFPFATEGKVLRVANAEDLDSMRRVQLQDDAVFREATEVAEELQLDLEVIKIEQILSGDYVTVYYMSDERVDFRKMVRVLASALSSRIEMRQIGARDEARLVADYERCGQQCCCKQFLKVLSPVPMRAAKMQKATLDPQKISGRCGRIMCCLRYEDSTYRELKSNLPHRRSRVGTSQGVGIVLSGQIITQLVLVELEADGSRVAVPVEDLIDPDLCPTAEDLKRIEEAHIAEKLRERAIQEEERNAKRNAEQPKQGTKSKRRKPSKKSQTQNSQRDSATSQSEDGSHEDQAEQPSTSTKKRRRKRKRRRQKQNANTVKQDANENQTSDGQDVTTAVNNSDAPDNQKPQTQKRKRRSRRKRKPQSQNNVTQTPQNNTSDSSG